MRHAPALRPAGRGAIIGLMEGYGNRTGRDDGHSRLLHVLGERVKELTLLHRAARLLGDDTRSIEDILRELVELVPPSWQYPDVTAARIRLGSLSIATARFTESPWLQEATFATADGKTGDITVVYLEERPPEAEGPFLAEERALIASVADMLRTALDRRRALYELRAANAVLEHRVAERTAALEEKNRALKLFSSSVAHDLKAPLRGIRGYSRILLEKYDHCLDAEGQRLLRAVQGSAQRMNQLIDDLLAYSRLEQHALAVAPIAVQPFVDALVEERRGDLVEGGIALVMDVRCDVILGDREALGQALRNYLDNAIKFTRGRAAPRIELGVAREGTRVRLWVRDNGIGFDMKYHDTIFEIFQRLHGEEEHPGTGVGLALVRKAMERHRGRAWAESAPGQGAMFCLEIPDTAVAPAGQAPPVMQTGSA